MPMCMKVESPITATMRLSASAAPRPLSAPSAIGSEAPMQTVLSRAFHGWPAPSV